MRLPNRAVARCCISSAALLVKVTARMRSGGVRRRISSAMRYVTTRVLPVPAPASTNRGPDSVWTASDCAAFRSIPCGSYAAAVRGGRGAGRDSVQVTTAVATPGLLAQIHAAFFLDLDTPRPRLIY